MRVDGRQIATRIWVTFDKIGMHKYPNAPEEVAYLRDVHRHVFKFKVAITVFHDDREIEFHMFKNWLTSLYQDKVLELDFKSCEMIAFDLIEQIRKKYDCKQRNIEVDVSEDGECGATVTSDWLREPVYGMGHHGINEILGNIGGGTPGVTNGKAASNIPGLAEYSVDEPAGDPVGGGASPFSLKFGADSKREPGCEPS